MRELFEFAINLAEQAGEITLNYFRTGFNIEVKSDESPVTIADRTTEEFLRGEIEKRYPLDGILGEEFGEKQGTSGIRWILDPIDGTKTFVRGVPMFGTMVAVESGGMSQIGVIRFPAFKETLAALSGHGCYCNGARCKVSEVDTLKRTTVVTSSFSDILKYQGENALIKVLVETGIQRTWGDCYGYFLLATGRADAAIDATMHEWDVAPLIPIVQEAGGKVTEVHGNAPRLTMNNMLATNGLMHNSMLELFS